MDGMAVVVVAGRWRWQSENSIQFRAAATLFLYRPDRRTYLTHCIESGR